MTKTIHWKLTYTSYMQVTQANEQLGLHYKLGAWTRCRGRVSEIGIRASKKRYQQWILLKGNTIVRLRYETPNRFCITWIVLLFIHASHQTQYKFKGNQRDQDTNGNKITKHNTGISARLSKTLTHEKHKIAKIKKKHTHKSKSKWTTRTPLKTWGMGQAQNAK